MNIVTMYSVSACPYCNKAEDLLTRLGVQKIHKIDVTDDSAQLDAMVALTQKRTVPQIFIGDTYVGGYDNLLSLHQAGTLQHLLTQA